MEQYTDIIRKRVSVRTYKPDPVEKEKLDELSAFITSNSTGPSGTRVRIAISGQGTLSREDARKYGTYSIIRGASLYLIGIVSSGSPPEDFGYVFEKAVLKSADLGLGTCWLGGTFRRSDFAEAAGLKDNELLFAVSPLGYSADHRSLADRAVRTIARSSGRLPFEQLFFEGRELAPLSQDAAGEPLELVRLGPSASNRQPWRVVRTGKVFHFYLARTRGYGKSLDVMDAADLQRGDIGIAMCHFDLATGKTAEGWVREDPGLDCSYEYIASRTL